MSTPITSVGLMSGSSLDGLDLACVVFRVDQDARTPQAWLQSWEITAAAMVPFSDDWMSRLREAPNLDGWQLAKTDADFGVFLGQQLQEFIQANNLTPDCIASHGHTVFHYPDQGFTTQIGCGAGIAALTGITTINNFRAQDIALGGQGAPLAPIADEYLFGAFDLCLNLGGIANLSAQTSSGYLAFDIGGANQILNAIVEPLGLAYDEGGALARKGQLLPDLLAAVDALPYFARPFPKSLGNDWVREVQWPLFTKVEGRPEDKLHTACRQLAGQIARAVNDTVVKGRFHTSRPKVMVTGGGTFNHFLLECIEEACARLQPIELIVPAPEIINYKEAALMALMGALHLSGRTNCRASVTGASRDTIGGSRHFAKPLTNN